MIFAGATDLAVLAAVTTGYVIVAAGLLQSAVYAAQLLLAAWVLAMRPPQSNVGVLWRRTADVAPPVAILVPAYNEERTIVASVRALLALRYPDYEVIVINDGSKDRTISVLKEEFALLPADRPFEAMVPHQPIKALYSSPQHPRLLIIDKDNGGKADAMNAGINLTRAPIFCAIDADSILEADALLRAVQPFVADPLHVVAVGGTIRILNGCRVKDGAITDVGLPSSLLALFQIIEYLRAFLMARLSLSRLETLTIISGAFGLFRRSIAVQVGGYSTDTVGEDLELVIKIHREMRRTQRRYRVEFIPEPVCWTEVPVSLRVLAAQRRRWQRGSLETYFKHRDMLFSPAFGRVGVLGVGQMLIVDVLGPIFETAGYLLLPILWACGLLDIRFLLAFAALTIAFGIFLSVGSLILEEIELRRFPRARDIVLLAVVAVLENFGYRQINNLWRLQGVIQYAKGTKGWGPATVRA
jgi:cellulose synthase/poly-beta-1,6-N-acetylglucosamine synthase-like glycosyltransferase